MSKRIWTPQAVLGEIHRLEHSGADLRHGAISAADQKLISAAVRYFGSWRAAVMAAGIDYREIRNRAEAARLGKVSKWSREQIVAEIKTMAADGQPVAASAARRARPALFSAAVSDRYFGSWKEAVIAAGIDYEATLAQAKSSTRRVEVRRMRSILNKIRLLDRGVLLLPPESIAARYPNLFQLATQHFESWQEAVHQATLPVRPHRPRKYDSRSSED